MQKQYGLNQAILDYARNTEEAERSTQGFYESQLRANSGITGIIGAIGLYNSSLKESDEVQADVLAAITKTNTGLGVQLKSLKGTTAGVGVFAKSLVKFTGQQLLEGLATGLTTTLVSLAVGAAVQGISYLANYTEEKMQKLKAELEESADTANAFAEESKTIDNLQSRYTDIITSTQDLKTAKEELKSIQDELNEAYGEEVKNLDLVNKSYGENIQKLIDQKRERANEYVSDETNKTNYSQAKKSLNESAQLKTKIFSLDGSKYKPTGNYAQVKAEGWGNFSSDKAYNILKEYDKEKVLSAANDEYTDPNYIYFLGTLDEQLENMKSVYSKLSKKWENKKSDSNEQKWLADLKKEIERVEKETKTAQDIIKVFETNEKIAKSTGNISSDIDSAIEAEQKYLNSNSSSEKIAAIEEIKKIKEAAYNANKDENGEIINQDEQDELDKFFDGIDTIIDGRVNGIYDEFQVYKETLAKFTNETYETVSSGLDKFDTAIASLRNNSSLDNSAVLELISLDPTLADSFTKTTDGYTIALDKIQAARSDFYYNSTKGIQKEIDGLEETRKELENERAAHYADFIDKHDGINGAGDIKALNSELKDTDDKIKEVVADTAQWRFYLKAIGAEFNPIEQSLSKISEIQELVSAQETLDKGLDIDDSIFSKYPELLSYVGSTSDLYREIGEIIDRIRNNAFEDLVDSDYTKEQIDGVKELFSKSDFDQLVQQAEGVTSSLDTLQSAYDSVANGEPLDVAWFEDFPDLAKFAGDTEDLLKALDGKSNTLPEDMIKAIEEYEKSNILSDMEEERLMAIKILLTQTKITNEKKRQESLINAKISKEEEQLDLLNKQKENIENTISDYETAANTVINAIDDEIESLEEAKAAIEEKYNTEIEALQQENEERERSNALREKELALEKAKNNKVRVYSASRGWVSILPSGIVIYHKLSSYIG